MPIIDTEKKLDTRLKEVPIRPAPGNEMLVDADYLADLSAGFRFLSRDFMKMRDAQEAPFYLDREVLQKIRRAAALVAKAEDPPPSLDRAYMALADAADRLDAMIARAANTGDYPKEKPDPIATARKVGQEIDAKLARDLCAVLQEHVGERGNSEGAVDALKRIIRERDQERRMSKAHASAFSSLSGSLFATFPDHGPDATPFSLLGRLQKEYRRMRRAEEESGCARVEDAIRILNELFEASPEAMERLYLHRVPCTAKLSEHPTCQVGATQGGFDLGIVRVLNALFGCGENGQGYIAAKIDDVTGNLVGFCTTPAFKKAVGK